MYIDLMVLDQSFPNFFFYKTLVACVNEWVKILLMIAISRYVSIFFSFSFFKDMSIVALGREININLGLKVLRQKKNLTKNR